ncbi:MAG TPA: hypothetical protein VFT78_15030 [Hanamia sp.]|nr:hypothetical protein [Hanamia sp.]
MFLIAIKYVIKLFMQVTFSVAMHPRLCPIHTLVFYNKIIIDMIKDNRNQWLEDNNQVQND